ncbi:hypothetical protein SHKM778_35590 [Streptomyces sp. KM77-8]|uniref:Uncharacterized protein n=1 Tax=Streptomyces haneummycinicus TaxID=3074435 RepID=A0AAT9HID2_9ACTN
MQVDALRRHIAGEQDAYRRVLEAEVLHALHLLLVGQTAVHDPGGLLGGLPLKPSAAGTVRVSHSSVCTRSENTTTRVSDFGPTPISRNCSTSAPNLPESASVIPEDSSSSRCRAARSAAVASGSSFFSSVLMRVVTVAFSAVCEERNDFSSVYGNRARR